MTADRLAQALNGRRYGDGWLAHCPAHDDKRPSLSLRTGSDGKLLWKCFAGCSQSDVYNAFVRRGLIRSKKGSQK